MHALELRFFSAGVSEAPQWEEANFRSSVRPFV